MSDKFKVRHYDTVPLTARDAAEMTEAILKALEQHGAALQQIQHLLIEINRRQAS